MDLSAFMRILCRIIEGSLKRGVRIEGHVVMVGSGFEGEWNMRILMVSVFETFIILVILFINGFMIII
jgi:hypothetical protein